VTARPGDIDAVWLQGYGWPEALKLAVLRAGDEADAGVIHGHGANFSAGLDLAEFAEQMGKPRPARLMPGIIAPVVRRDGSARQPREIDMYIVRENTEGEYSAVGGCMYPGTDREIVMQETIMSQVGVDRVLKFAFDLAQSRPKKHLTSATKSNGIAITMPYWDERVAEMAKRDCRDDLSGQSLTPYQLGRLVRCRRQSDCPHPKEQCREMHEPALLNAAVSASHRYP